MIYAIPMVTFIVQNAGVKRLKRGETQTRREQKRSVKKAECAIRKQPEKELMNGTKKITPDILLTWLKEEKRTLFKSFLASCNPLLASLLKNITLFSPTKKARVQFAKNIHSKTKNVSPSIIATKRKKFAGYFAQPAIKQSAFLKTM